MKNLNQQRPNGARGKRCDMDYSRMASEGFESVNYSLTSSAASASPTSRSSACAGALTGKTEQQIKLEIRRVVEDASGLRPNWSARDARNAIKRVQL